MRKWEYAIGGYFYDKKSEKMKAEVFGLDAVYPDASNIRLLKKWI